SGTPSRSTTAGSASGWSPSGSPAARPRPREVLDRPPRRGGRRPEAVSSDDGATGRELPQLAPCSATCAPGLDRKKTIRGSQVLVGEQVRTGRLRVGALGPRYDHRPRAASLAISPDGASCERVQIAVYLLLGTDTALPRSASRSDSSTTRGASSHSQSEIPSSPRARPSRAWKSVCV